VRDAVAENLSQRDELGAAVAVILEDRPVVDLWCGWADAARTRPWRGDTLVCAFSVGKPLAGLCLLKLVARGVLDLDEPVVGRWPEFGQAGKEAITVRQVLSHRAGLPAISEELPPGALYRWESVAGALERQRPWWTPGEGHGYHVHTLGFLVGELVRRVAGEPVGSVLEREIARPLGAEISFGLPAARRARCAEYVFPEDNVAAVEEFMRSGAMSELRARAYLNPPGAMGVGTVNTTAWQDAEIPSANLHAHARGVARIYAALVQGDSPLLDAGVLAQATTEASAGTDLVLERPSRFGLGFQLTQPERPMGTNPGSFGHFGAGGSVGFADPQAGLAFAYVMNRGGPQWQDPRNRALITATYEALNG
jgi:CubicO group peptidase (beta-lactamase class C family)